MIHVQGSQLIGCYSFISCGFDPSYTQITPRPRPCQVTRGQNLSQWDFNADIIGGEARDTIKFDQLPIMACILLSTINDLSRFPTTLHVKYRKGERLLGRAILLKDVRPSPEGFTIITLILVD